MLATLALVLCSHTPLYTQTNQTPRDTQPTNNSLVIQSILPIKNALESKQAQLWVWGKPATGELKRPFKAPPGLFGAAGQGGAQTDKAAIKEAEKAGGAKAAKKDE